MARKYCLKDIKIRINNLKKILGDDAVDMYVSTMRSLYTCYDEEDILNVAFYYMKNVYCKIHLINEYYDICRYGHYSIRPNSNSVSLINDNSSRISDYVTTTNGYYVTYNEDWHRYTQAATYYNTL